MKSNRELEHETSRKSLRLFKQVLKIDECQSEILSVKTLYFYIIIFAYSYSNIYCTVLFRLNQFVSWNIAAAYVHNHDGILYKDNWFNRKYTFFHLVRTQAWSFLEVDMDCACILHSPVSTSMVFMLFNTSPSISPNHTKYMDTHHRRQIGDFGLI